MTKTSDLQEWGINSFLSLSAHHLHCQGESEVLIVVKNSKDTMRELKKRVDYLRMQGKLIGSSEVNNLLASGWFLPQRTGLLFAGEAFRAGNT